MHEMINSINFKAKPIKYSIMIELQKNTSLKKHIKVKSVSAYRKC